MNEIEIDLSKYIDNFKIDKDKAKQYGGYKKIANDLSKENIKLAFENTILQSKIDKAIEYIDGLCKCSDGTYFNYGDDLSPKHIVDILKEDK